MAEQLQVLRFRVQGASSLDYEIRAIRKNGQVRMLCNCQAARRQFAAGCSHRIELLSGELKSVLPGSDDLGKLAALIHGTELEASMQAYLALEHTRVVAAKTARAAKEHLYFVMDYDPDQPPAVGTKLGGDDGEGKH